MAQGETAQKSSKTIAQGLMKQKSSKNYGLGGYGTKFVKTMDQG